MKMGVTTRSAGTPSAELLSFDSEWWSATIARANSSLMDEWARENTVGCLWLLIPAHDQADIHRAEVNGALVMDIRHEFAMETEPRVGDARPFNAGEVDALAAISRTAFRGLTRFYADPRFPDDRCDDLYENWLRQSADGWAAEILVVGDGDGPVGFVTIHVDADEASIGLIATAEHVRGKGIGRVLTASAIDWAYQQRIPHMTVVTQGCNIAAQRTFQGAGFRTSDVSVWLHRWYS